MLLFGSRQLLPKMFCLESAASSQPGPSGTSQGLGLAEDSPAWLSCGEVAAQSCYLASREAAMGVKQGLEAWVLFSVLPLMCW